MKRKDFFELWIKALESGEYKQGKGYLQQSNGKFCCLGVACDLANKTGVRKVEIVVDDNTCLPLKMQNFLGISGIGDFSKTVVYKGNGWESLAGLNDDGMTFKQIAKVIRRKLESGDFIF